MSDITDYINTGVNAGAFIYNIANNAANKRAEIGRWEQQVALDNSAVQRRVADLKAAGLHPTLAAGGAATTPSGQPARGEQVQAPQFSRSNELMASQISAQKQQAALVKAQIDHTKADEDRIRLENNAFEARELRAQGTYDQSTKASEREADRFAYEVTRRIYREYGEALDHTAREYGLTKQAITNAIEQAELQHIRKYGAKIPTANNILDTVARIFGRYLETPQANAAAEYITDKVLVPAMKFIHSEDPASNWIRPKYEKVKKWTEKYPVVPWNSPLNSRKNSR